LAGLAFLSGIIMNKALRLLLSVTALLAIAVPLHAQSGCTDSPENPTIILAIVGSVAALFSTVRSRQKARRDASAR
jgi:XrtJ-associated TM-motif-TM protein